MEPARLAPLVVTAAADGEPVAGDLFDEAAALLAQSTARVRPTGDTTPIVRGGGLLTGATPLAAAVRAEVGRRWPDAPLCSAGGGAATAAWLAARWWTGAQWVWSVQAGTDAAGLDPSCGDAVALPNRFTGTRYPYVFYWSRQQPMRLMLTWWG